jgi:hypothetical protein
MKVLQNQFSIANLITNTQMPLHEKKYNRLQMTTFKLFLKSIYM